MGLSAFNAMRARLAREQGQEKKPVESAVKVTEVSTPVKEVEKPAKKKTDAEKLKKE